MPENSPDNVTVLLGKLRIGEVGAADQLLSVVYEELRRRARGMMAVEKAGQTLQPTALVHEAYLRLLANFDDSWQNRRHFYGAAAEAMRRILVERARHYQRLKHGGGRQRVPLTEVDADVSAETVDMIALDEALNRLEQHDPRKKDVVMLRYFAGLQLEQIAETLDVSLKTVDRDWRYARAWLFDAMSGDAPTD